MDDTYKYGINPYIFLIISSDKLPCFVQGSVSEWRLVFLISLIVYFSGFVVYAIFGSSDPHKFNRALEKLKNEKNK